MRRLPLRSALAWGATRAYRLYASGAVTIDSAGRRLQTLGPLTWEIADDRETVFELQAMHDGQAVGAPGRKVISTGPGPSIVDVPSAGCWRLKLRWSGRSDTLDLDYAAPS